jgi:hypothetical protein
VGLEGIQICARNSRRGTPVEDPSFREVLLIIERR